MSLIPNVQNSAAQPPSTTSVQASATPPQSDYTTHPALTLPTDPADSPLAFLRTHDFPNLAEKLEELFKLDKSSQNRQACESDVNKAIETARFSLLELAGRIKEDIAFQREIFEKQEVCANVEHLFRKFMGNIDKSYGISSFQNQLTSIVTLIAEENGLEKAYQQEYNALHFKPNCGKATLRLKSTDAPCEVSITREILSVTQYRFYAYPVDCGPEIEKIIGNRIGEITCSLRQKKDASGFTDEGRSACYLDTTPIIYIDDMYRKTGKYKDVGRMLLQAALEEGYAHGCEDAALDACYSSHAFHYLQGFRSPQAWINKRIAKIVEQNQRTGTLQNTKSLGGVPMYLAPQGKKYWKIQITEHPILDTTKEERVMCLLRS